MSAQFFAVGISHHTASVELREQLSVPSHEVPKLLERIASSVGIAECMMVSTCNRVEVYGIASSSLAVSQVVEILAAYAPQSEMQQSVYRYFGGDAVRHILRVAASLDSMIIGEPQILGQLKRAHELAIKNNVTGMLLNRCLQHALSTAKKIRTKTGIGEGGVSVSSVACDLASRILGNLQGRVVLLVGAGKIGEQTARFLSSRGCEVWITNRSAERGRQLAHKFGGQFREFDNLEDHITQADVVISSTSHAGYIINETMIKALLPKRRFRPLFLIDLAVPRDIDPNAAKPDGVFCYDIDDLRQAAEDNIKARRGEIELAEELVETEVRAFEQWLRSLEVKPTIIALREKFLGILEHEKRRQRALLRELDDQQFQAMQRIWDSAMNKLLHGAIDRLKNAETGLEKQELVFALQQLFTLGQEHSREETQRKDKAHAQQQSNENQDRDSKE